MTENPFPNPPEGRKSLLPRSIPSVVWWVVAIVLLGIAIIWLPTQCISIDTNLSDQKEESTKELSIANQDKELEYREDDLWYRVGSQETFSGVAVAYHEDNVTVRSRTKLKDGKAYGLIEEWDENGTLKGRRFKGEFPK